MARKINKSGTLLFLQKTTIFKSFYKNKAIYRNDIELGFFTTTIDANTTKKEEKSFFRG